MEALIAQTHVHVLVNGGGPVVAQFAHCLSLLLLVAPAYHGGLTSASPDTPKMGDTVGDKPSSLSVIILELYTGHSLCIRKTGVC